MKRICLSMLIMLIGLSCFHTDSPKSTRVDMIKIDGGTFIMGSNDSKGYGEKPAHEVVLSSFQMSKTEVTQALYQEVMGTNPSYFKGDKLPVEQVSWYEAVEFCNKLSLLDGLSPAYTINNSDPDLVSLNLQANGFRLPTEAQWEFAAKGGNKSKNYTYAGSIDPDVVSWFNVNANNTSHEVATKLPNELGLYDMSGNVWEWCFDWFGTYDGNAAIDPMGAPLDDNRVFRGGSWYYGVKELRVAYRGISFPSDRYNSGLGFRVVLPAL